MRNKIIQLCILSLDYKERELSKLHHSIDFSKFHASDSFHQIHNHRHMCLVNQPILPNALPLAFISLTLQTIGLSMLTNQNESHRCIFPELRACGLLLHPIPPSLYSPTQSDHVLLRLKGFCWILQLPRTKAKFLEQLTRPY